MDDVIDRLRSHSLGTCRGTKEPFGEAAALLEAFQAVPLYTQELDWGEDGEETERGRIDVCVGCGFPGQGDHDGAPEDCPVGRLEALLRRDR